MFVSLESGLSSYLTSFGLPFETRPLGFPWLFGPDFYLFGEGLTLLLLIILDLPFLFSSFSIDTFDKGLVTSFSSLLLLFWGFSSSFVFLGDCLLFSYLWGDGTLSLTGDTFLFYFLSSALTDFYFFISSFAGCGLPASSPSFLPFSFLLFLSGSLGLFFLSSFFCSFYLDSKDLFLLLYFFFSGLTSFNLLSKKPSLGSNSSLTIGLWN